MRITISGGAGTGKTTLAKSLAEKFDLKYYSVGGMQRNIANEKGLTITELSKLEEEDPSIDKMIDEKQKELGEAEDDFVIEGRLCAYFIPHADKRILLKCNLRERAKRVFNADRSDEKNNTLEQTIENINKRENSDRKRYKELYNVDFEDESLYNIIIDTTDKSPKEVMALI